MMYQLVILNGERRGERISVVREPMIIGRAETCAIRFNDPEIALAHAEISQKPEGLFIRDLGSANRLTINNRAVREIHPQHGDVIEVGQTRFMVQFHDRTEIESGEEDDKLQLYKRWLTRGGVLLVGVGLLYAMMQCRPTLPPQPPLPPKPPRPVPSNPARTNATFRTHARVPQPEVAPAPSPSATAVEPEAPESARPAAATPPSHDTPLPSAPIEVSEIAIREANEPSTASPAAPKMTADTTILLAQQELQEAEKALLGSKVRDMMEEAQNLASNKGPAAAEQVLAVIETLQPDYLEASAARAAMLEEQGKLDPALTIWDRLRQRAAPNSPLAVQAEGKLQKLARAKNQLVFPFVGRIKIAGVTLNKPSLGDPSLEGRVLSLRLIATELQPEIDPDAVRLEIRFYDQEAQTGRIVPSAARTSIVPLAIPGPWRATEERSLEASCPASAFGTTNAPAARSYGYVIRVRYYGALQDERSQPGDLPATEPPAEPPLSNKS